jgi:iron complex transport system substrate-binding protein
MRKAPYRIPVFYLILLQGLCLVFTSAAIAVEVTDDDGKLVVLAQPATRIISLAPSLTEIIFAAGAGNKVVGVVEFSDFPEAATQIPIVGRHDLLNLEAILALEPDLVVSWKTGNPQTSIDRIRDFGISVYVAEPKQLQDISKHMKNLGALAATTAIAESAAAQFDETLRRLQLEFSAQAPVDVFYQVWDTPLITIGGNELINDIVTLCGGRNIFADLMLMAPKIDKESVLARNPQVIVASGMDVARPEWLDDWLEWTTLPAVANQHLYFIPPELLQRHTPRALQGAQLMCEQIDRARTQP